MFELIATIPFYVAFVPISRYVYSCSYFLLPVFNNVFQCRYKCLPVVSAINKASEQRTFCSGKGFYHAHFLHGSHTVVVIKIFYDFFYLIGIEKWNLL